MKYIKTYERWGIEINTDIREFFSNLKKLSYYFEDYNIFNDMIEEISKETDYKSDMPFFGFTNETESQYSPIIDYVTKVLHKIFKKIEDSDYDGIYNWLNNDSNGYFYFEKNPTNTSKYLSYKISNTLSERIAKDLNWLEKPYYSVNFRFGYNTPSKKDIKEKYKIIQNIIDKYNINDKYNISYYEYGSKIEFKIIAKKRIEFNPEQLKEIENAREYGEEKYNYIKGLDGLNSYSANKYNL